MCPFVFDAGTVLCVLIRRLNKRGVVSLVCIMFCNFVLQAQRLLVQDKSAKNCFPVKFCFVLVDLY